MAGEATSARADALKTPSDRPYLPVPSSTPAKVPEPMRKKILAADLKMAKELRKAGMGEEEIREYQQQKENKRHAQAMETPEKERAKVEKQRLREEKARDKERKQVDKEEKKAKEPKKSSGPMEAAMKVFADAQRAQGTKYIQAMRLWKQSDERAEILNNMTESERKRRRY